MDVWLSSAAQGLSTHPVLRFSGDARFQTDRIESRTALYDLVSLCDILTDRFNSLLMRFLMLPLRDVYDTGHHGTHLIFTMDGAGFDPSHTQGKPRGK